MTYQDALVLITILVSTKAHLHPDLGDLPWSGDGGVVTGCWHNVCLSEQG